MHKKNHFKPNLLFHQKAAELAYTWSDTYIRESSFINLSFER